MLLNKTVVVLLAVIFIPPGAHAESASSISCPTTITQHRHALKGARLFDGPPEELTELVPDHEGDGTWDISGYRNSDRTLILVCDYAKGKSQALRVPKTASSCAIRGHKKITVSCR